MVLRDAIFLGVVPQSCFERSSFVGGGRRRQRRRGRWWWRLQLICGGVHRGGARRAGSSAPARRPYRSRSLALWACHRGFFTISGDPRPPEVSSQRGFESSLVSDSVLFQLLVLVAGLVLDPAGAILGPNEGVNI